MMLHIKNSGIETKNVKLLSSTFKNHYISNSFDEDHSELPF